VFSWRSILTIDWSSAGDGDSLITITSKSRYAVRALTELARLGALPGGQPVPIAELARRRDIPIQFLEQLFATLRRAGMLQSQRGVKGGYTFMKDPSELTVLQVVQLLDGEFEGEAGSGAGESQDVWIRAVAALREVLSSTTIADVMQREAEAAGAAMYYI
jgi:Rrf2 family transcriptional regulator, cysteine metabolism repressor